MIQFENSELRVDVLDPIADQALQGARYAWGGYIWQVYDVAGGAPLLSGPEWPHPTPSPYNGQGLPESFRHRTREGRELTWSGDVGVALGAGTIRAAEANTYAVMQPCVWEIQRSGASLHFKTSQRAAGLDYQLERILTLEGRSLHSITRLTNYAKAPLNLEWFAHPFFALTDGVVRATVAKEARLPENPGFAVDQGRFSQKRRFIGTNDGHMNFLQLGAGQTLRASLEHPLLTGLTFSTSFAPSECVIWGNGNTFSFEPYRTLSIAPGTSDEWSLTYDFGASSGTSSPGTKARTPVAR